MKVKINWEVSQAPTGRYKSFHRRGWPVGFTTNTPHEQRILIQCEDEYIPAKVKSGEHKPLMLKFDCWKDKKMMLVGLANKFSTLKEAKAAA